MKRSVFILVFTIFAAFAAPAQVNVGMTDTASYYPLLRGRRVAVLANQTSVAELPGAPGADASGRVHLVDLLHGEGFASRRSSRPSTDSAARPMPGSGSQVRSTPGRHSHPLALRRQRETPVRAMRVVVRVVGRSYD